jgi:hypothetical protein
VAGISVGCGWDKAKTYRIEFTADSGGEPVGNYTLQGTVQ